MSNDTGNIRFDQSEVADIAAAAKQAGQVEESSKPGEINPAEALMAAAATATQTEAPAEPKPMRVQIEEAVSKNQPKAELALGRGLDVGTANLLSAVQATHESKLPDYGAVGGKRVGGRRRLYAVDGVLEKPTPTEAEQRLIVPGLRAGHYLCFFGMHVLTPAVLELLAADVAAAGEAGGVQLSPALARLATQERYLAYEVEGRRFDIGARYGLLVAQLALALEGDDRDEVLADLVELLATRR